MGLATDVLAGAIGGVAGAMTMTAGMMAGKQTGMVQTPLPLRIERKLEERAGVDEKTTAGQEKAIAQGGHMMMGAVFGALYGLLRNGMRLPAVPGGPVYGLGIYALNLAGVGPALNLTPGPWREQPMTVGRRVMMHLVYGTVTALVSDQVRQRMD